jgi:NAD-dependent DNA ligase
MRAMSTTNSPDTPISTAIEGLSKEEKSIYQELFRLSERIRVLDAAYYSRDTNKSTDLEISDDEYDALARKEAELCTAHPHLLAYLERETGLGNKATRFGGRVGQLYADGNEKDGNLDKKTKKATRSPVKKRLKRQHLSNAPMQSLDNAMDEVEAVAWLNRVRRLLLSAKQYQSEDEDVSGLREFPIT